MASGAEEDLEQGGSAMMATTSQLQQEGQQEAEADNQCSICLGMINNAAYIDGCFHTFCFGCIQRWASMSAVCLLCRRPFSRLLHTVRADDDYQEYVVGSSTCQEKNAARHPGHQEPVHSRPLQRRYGLRLRLTTNQLAGRIRENWGRHHRAWGGAGPRPCNTSARQAAEKQPDCPADESVQCYDMLEARIRLLRFVETE